MKKLIIPILLFVLASCQKPIEDLKAGASFVITTAPPDSVVCGVIDFGGQVLRYNGKILRKGCEGTIIKNAIIDCPLTKQFFDTGIVLQNCQTYGYWFSAMWQGADVNNADNYNELQKWINTIKNTGLHGYLPPLGTYVSLKQLDVETIYNGVYVGTYIDITGGYSFWGPQNCVISTPILGGSAINFQLNKGSSIKGVFFKGTKWKSPGGTDAEYFPLTAATYNDVSGNNIGQYQFGISIDAKQPLGGQTGGSTGITFDNVGVDGFHTLFSMSANGKTANCEDMTASNIFVGNGKYFWDNGNPQEKNMRIIHAVGWSSLYCFFRNGYAGKFGAGEYHIENCSVAYRVIRPFEINTGGFSSTYISNFQAESIRDIGFSIGKFPVVYETCKFKLNLLASIRQDIKFWGDGNKRSVFRNNTIGYNNGAYDNVYFHYDTSAIYYPNTTGWDGDKIIYK